jgi:hypothetical protein
MELNYISNFVKSACKKNFLQIFSQIILLNFLFNFLKSANITNFFQIFYVILYLFKIHLHNREIWTVCFSKVMVGAGRFVALCLNPRRDIWEQSLTILVNLSKHGPLRPSLGNSGQCAEIWWIRIRILSRIRILDL